MCSGHLLLRHVSSLITHVFHALFVWACALLSLLYIEPRVCGTVAECKATPLLQRSAKQWLSWNEHIELYADARCGNLLTTCCTEYTNHSIHKRR